MDNQINYRISLISGIIFIFTAGIFDILTFIPLVGDFIGWIFWIGASIYLWYTGHGLSNWKIAVPEITSTIAELIPAVQSLPTIITGAIIIFTVSRVEDRTGVKLIPSKKPGVTPPRLNRQQLNSKPGIRYPNKN